MLRTKLLNLTTGCKALCASGGDSEETRSDSWSVHQRREWTWPVRWRVHLAHCSWVSCLQQWLSEGGGWDPGCQHGWCDKNEPRWCGHHHVNTKATGARHQAEESWYGVKCILSKIRVLYKILYSLNTGLWNFTWVDLQFSVFHTWGRNVSRAYTCKTYILSGFCLHFEVYYYWLLQRERQALGGGFLSSFVDWQNDSSISYTQTSSPTALLSNITNIKLCQFTIYERKLRNKYCIQNHNKFCNKPQTHSLQWARAEHLEEGSGNVDMMKIFIVLTGKFMHSDCGVFTDIEGTWVQFSKYYYLWTNGHKMWHHSCNLRLAVFKTIRFLWLQEKVE